LADEEHLSSVGRDALRAFRRAIDARPAIPIRWEPGDILIIDNRRMLHARTSIVGHRKLVRYWLSA